MKKILVVCMLFVGINSYAQFIPKAGLTLSKVAFKEPVDIKSNVGFTIGVGYNVKISKVFSLQPELNFIQKGFNVDQTDESSGSTVFIQYRFMANYTLNYLEVPVLAKATFGSGTKFFLLAGPSLGLGVGGKYAEEAYATRGSAITADKTNGKIKFGTVPASYKGDDEYFDNKIDFGVQFGGGLIVAKKITLDLRYGLGLSNLQDKYPRDSNPPKSKNRVVQFTVGYIIGK